ncbi:hypothetical protein AB0E62_35895 [Streptomyces sp. NPDC038707]|uniref:hypothetical protein n=1 Tax=Streptomyces sp. NPDC038707 TaxID=3154329 RepID=UPI0033D16C6D
MIETVPEQLALPSWDPATTADPWQERALHTARTAISLDRSPGYTAFTTGQLTIDSVSDTAMALVTDSPWAANAMRTVLIDAGYAVDSDPDHTSTRITAWAVRQAPQAPATDLVITMSTDDSVNGGQFVLTGPDGCIEQQYGAGGHNDLVAHAPHPHPGATRGVCTRHGALCFTRYAWPHRARVRHLLAADTSAWRMTAAADQRMRDLYIRHIHATRHTV